MRITLIDPNFVTRNWGAVALRGIVALAFGVLALAAPGPTATALVLVIGAYLFVDGILHLVAAFRARGGNVPWWAHALQGVAGVAAGVLTAFWPGITALALLYLIAAWAIVSGAFEIYTAVRLRKVIEGEWLLGLVGLLSVALGVALIVFPGPGVLALLFWLGAFAVVSGVILLIAAFRIRRWARTHRGEPPRSHGSLPPRSSPAE